MLTCVCITHGRMKQLRRSLACFLAQDFGPHAGRVIMLIYNFHKFPMRLARPYPGVELVNVPHEGTVAEVWADALSMVRTKYVHPWYDDDLYLPWAARQGLDLIGDAKAFKPRFFYQLIGETDLSKTENVGEGSLTIATVHARELGLQDGSDALFSPLTRVIDDTPSWIFRWSDGLCKSEGISRDMTPQQRNAYWRSQNRDVGDGLLSPSDVSEYYSLVAKFDGDAAARLAR